MPDKDQCPPSRIRAIGAGILGGRRGPSAGIVSGPGPGVPDQRSNGASRRRPQHGPQGWASGCRTCSAESNKQVAVLRDTPGADGQISTDTPYAEIMDPAAATEYLEAHLSQLAKSLAGEDDWEVLPDAAAPVAAAYITDTLRFDSVYTDGARERARKSVEPVMKRYSPRKDRDGAALDGQSVRRAGHLDSRGRHALLAQFTSTRSSPTRSWWLGPGLSSDPFSFFGGQVTDPLPARAAPKAGLLSEPR